MGTLVSLGTRLLLIGCVVALLGGLLPMGGDVPAAPAAQLAASDEVVFVLRDGVDPVRAARDLGVTPTYIYRSVFSGFAGRLPAASIAAANRSSQVELVSPNVPLTADAQVSPTGVERIEARDAWPAPNPPAIDAGVAILDSGIQKRQAPDQRERCDQSKPSNKKKCQRRKQSQNERARDLDVAGGTRCIGRGSPTVDPDGHGTHVAGTVGARNNTFGAVGVAPGVRLYAVQVLDSSGVGSVASAVCGLDWVHEHSNLIDVVNMSLSGRGPENTTSCSSDALHLAVCRVVNRGGISVVVAAGNNGQNASNFIPASYNEVITVSAFADTNGEPGGGGAECHAQDDDTYVSYSNFGEAVDIAAPGICIRSTRTRGGTFLLSGTSMATPHVSGALALYYAANPAASVSDARTWLLTKASVAQNEPGGLIKPGPSNEPVLFLDDVSPQGD